MPICLLIGIILIFCGVIYIFLRRGQNSDTETNIEIKDFKLKGGPGSILIVLGVLLIAFESFVLPNTSGPTSSEVTPSEVTPSEVTPSEVTPTESQQSASAEIEKVWYEHNAQEGNLPGMKIHVMFNTHNLKGENCVASAYFYSSSGEALKDYNQLYNTYDGSVSAGAPFTPNSVDTFNDHLIIFIPYNELHMAPGSYQLKFNVVIWHGSTKLAESYLTSFNYVQYY